MFSEKSEGIEEKSYLIKHRHSSFLTSTALFAFISDVSLMQLKFSEKRR
jgi:hypothetical protein